VNMPWPVSKKRKRRDPYQLVRPFPIPSGIF
jgi:hypothetical protein